MISCDQVITIGNNMSHIMGSITDKEMDALHGLQIHTQIIFMFGIIPWVGNCNGIRKEIINIRTIQSRSSPLEQQLTAIEIDKSLDILQRRNLLKFIKKSDMEYEIELMFDDEL